MKTGRRPDDPYGRVGLGWEGRAFMVARGDGSVALFFEVSEMNGKHAPSVGATMKVAPTDGRICLFMCIIAVYGCLD